MRNWLRPFLTGGLIAAAAAAAAQDVETAFLAGCRAEILAANAAAAPWVDRECADRLERVDAAGLIVDLVLSLAPAEGAAPPALAAATAGLPGIAWSPAGDGALVTGALGDVLVSLRGSEAAVAAVQVHWEEQAGYPPYDVLGALRLRGAAVVTLGCPLYFMASAGQEKVVAVEAPGHAPFALTVYHRPAPTGTEWGLYTVDAGFGAALPDAAMLAAGAYPGGGGRAFATEAQEWSADCPDPM